MCFLTLVIEKYIKTEFEQILFKTNFLRNIKKQKHLTMLKRTSKFQL